MSKEKKKAEYKFRIIKRKALGGSIYEVQLFRKFLWREWRTDVKGFEYKCDAEELIECLQAYEYPEVVREYNIKL